MDVLHLIVARGGSRGVARKNLAEIGGLPLLAYKARAAARSRRCRRVVISTDDADIARVAAAYDVEVPFMRPAYLATDEASTFDVIAHALEHFERNEARAYDAVVLLEPSAPFATSEDLDTAIELFMERSAALVVGMVEHKLHPAYIGEMGSDGSIASIVRGMLDQRLTNRQARPRQFTMNGTLYVFRTDAFRAHGTIYGVPERSYGLVMDPFRSIEIDEPVDLAWAEFLVSKGHIDVSAWR